MFINFRFSQSLIVESQGKYDVDEVATHDDRGNNVEAQIETMKRNEERSSLRLLP